MPESDAKSAKKKIISLSEAAQTFQNRTGGTVLVGGCYDILHFGHIDFLKKSKAAGEYLVVALESDDFIIRSKSRAPVHTQHQRAQILASLESVDAVIMLPLMNGHEDYRRLVEAVRPEIIAVTKGDPNYIYKKKHADAVGAKLQEVCELNAAFSSTQILTYANILRD